MVSKKLWSDGKTESDICKMTDYGKSVFNLMEDIRCLKEDRNAVLDKVQDIVRSKKSLSRSARENFVLDEVILSIEQLVKDDE